MSDAELAAMSVDDEAFDVLRCVSVVGQSETLDDAAYVLVVARSRCDVDAATVEG